MKYLKLYENFNDSDIHDICDKYKIENYTINDDGTIDINGDVNFYVLISKLPLKFRNVTDNFDCGHNKLTTLENCPEYVEDVFVCIYNKLDSLKFMPKCSVFNCAYNNIRDFKYFVEPVEDFFCIGNPIYEIWKLFKDKSYIELLNEYDCIRGEDIVIDRFNEFLEEIDKPKVESVQGYNNI